MHLVSDKMKLLIALIGLACVAPGLSQRGFRQGQPCYTPENDIGQCFTLSYCPSIANVFNVYPRDVATQYVQTAQRNCGNVVIRRDPVVCCSTNQEQTQTTTARPTNPFFPTNAPPTVVGPATRPPPPRTTTTTTTTTPAPPPPSTTSGISDRSSTCRGPDSKPGICTPIQSCPELIGQLERNPTDTSFAQYLRISNQICANEYAVVCCPTNSQLVSNYPLFPKNTNTIPKTLPTMEEGCGYVHSSFRKIVGGKTSLNGAWPWIALIGYDDGISASPFKCGGALITSRHVLTAAHCIRSDLTFVRLGEHDLSTDTETNHVDVPVTKMLKHPEYNRADGHNDIAMLYLNRNVEFSARITPICLPISPQLRSQSFVNRNPFVAGWGKTMEGGQSATVLQELQIPVYDNAVCKDLYRKQNKLISEQQFDDAVLCAGVLAGGKDTCQGDSGGPLMTPEQFDNSIRFHLIGVVSYGIGCARPEIPGVYSRVAKFIDTNWIQNAVANTP